jgi:hypothetical protein
VIVSGHWPPQEVTGALLDRLLEDGRRLAELHRELLPLDEADLGAVGFAARIEPYRSAVRAGETLALQVIVRNPFGRDSVATVALAVPDGWTAPPAQELALEPHAQAAVAFEVTAGSQARRARVGADVTVDGVRFGQQAEALVDVS